MRNLKRKFSGLMVMAMLLTAVLGAVKPMEAKAMGNIQPGQFGIPIMYSANSGTIAYEVELPSAGMVTQVLDVSGDDIGINIYDSAETKIYEPRYENGKAYTDNFWLIGGKYYFEIYQLYTPSSPKASVKWTFESAGETFDENHDARNNDIKQASPLQLGSNIKGQLAANDDKDIYSFSISKSGVLGLNITDYNQSGLEISLVNEDGTFNHREKDLPKGKKNAVVQLTEGNYYLTFSGSGAGCYSFKTIFVGSPEAVKLISAKNIKKGKLRVNWKKLKEAAGYEVQVSSSSNFNNDSTSTKIVKGAKKKSIDFTGFRKNSYSNNTYYCRIRAYKAKSKIKAYSDWSEVKEAVIKK